MSYRNRAQLCALLTVAAASVFSACGGLDSKKVIITDGGSAGEGTAGRNTSGSAGSAGKVSNAGSSAEGGAAGSTSEGGEGGEGGAYVPPEPMPGAPTVVSVSPKDKTLNVENASSVKITFSEPLAPASVTADSVQIKDASGAVVAGAVSYADGVVTFTPDANFALLGAYNVNVSTAVTDASGTALEAAFTSGFTIRDGVWGKAETALGTVTAYDLSSQVAVASDGGKRAVAAWAQSGSTAYEIYASFYSEGKGWATPAKVNTGTSSARYPALAMNASGNVTVVWMEFDATLGNSIQGRRYVGGAWDPAQARLDLPATPAVTPDTLTVAMTAKNESHVVWSSYSYDSTAGVDYWGVWTRHASAAGTWDATSPYLAYAQVSSGVGWPSLAFDAAGNGFCAYQFAAGSPVKVTTFVHRYVASTAKWGSSAIGATPSDSYGQAVGLATDPTGGAVLVYPRVTGTTTYDLMGSYYNKAWSTPVVISNATTTISLNRSIPTVWTGSSYLVAWAQSGGTPYNVYTNEYKTAWGSASIISDGNHTSSFPSLAADGRGNALMLWVQQSDAVATTAVLPTDVFFSRFTGTGSKWSTPAAVSSAFAGYRYPQVAVLGDGTAVASWQRSVRNGKLTSVTGVLQNEFQ
ncbi:MAG: Ig-like domain-containing protein [Myxococcales bacterium]